MFREGNILTFDQYQYEDGSSTGMKHMIILKAIDSEQLVTTLLTSKTTRLQGDEGRKPGCQHLEHVSYHGFEPNEMIGDRDFAASSYTYLVHHDIKIKTLASLQSQPSTPRLRGKLSQSELDEIIACIQESQSVPFEILDLFP